MTQKFKVGDKVRIINTEAIDGGSERWKNGEITEVVSFRDGYPQLRINRGRFAGLKLVVTTSEFDYIEKVPTKKQRLSDAEKQLTEQATRIAELEAKVEALEKAQNPETIAKELAKGLAKHVAKPTANEQRKAIIAEAKACLEAQKQDFHGKRLYQVGPYMVEAEFIVNKEKRAVTALLYWHSPAMKECGEPRELKAKGIAKCAPDDVFNADIGKAIALGRSLGLDVERFEQAVKPTEVVVGHIVTFPKSDSWYMRHNYRVDSLTNSRGLTVVYNEIEGLDKRLGGTASMHGAFTLDTIIDDTEAQY